MKNFKKIAGQPVTSEGALLLWSQRHFYYKLISLNFPISIILSSLECDCLFISVIIILISPFCFFSVLWIKKLNRVEIESWQCANLWFYVYQRASMKSEFKLHCSNGRKMNQNETNSPESRRPLQNSNTSYDNWSHYCEGQITWQTG